MMPTDLLMGNFYDKNRIYPQLFWPNALKISERMTEVCNFLLF